MTVEMIVSILGIAISLAASYVPPFNDWYNGLDEGAKRRFMLLAGFVVVAGAFGLSCLKVLGYFTCTWLGAVDAAKLFWAFMVSNQTTYLLSRKLLRFSRH